MPIIELELRRPDGLLLENAQVCMETVSTGELERLIDQQWDNVLVHRWAISEGSEDDNSERVLVRIVGEYFCEEDFFKPCFADEFARCLRQLDPEVQIETLMPDDDCSEAYIISNEEKEYCVLDTNDVIMMEDSLLVNRRGAKLLRDKFGPFDPVKTQNEDSIKDPIKFAKMIQRISNIDCNDNEREKLSSLELDLKTMLFAEHHQLMLTSLINESERPNIQYQLEFLHHQQQQQLEQQQRPGARIAQQTMAVFRRWLRLFKNRAFWSLYMESLTKTMKAFIVLVILGHPFGIGPFYTVLAFFNQPTVGLCRMFAEETGVPFGVFLARLFAGCYDLVMQYYRLSIVWTVAMLRGPIPINVGEEYWERLANIAWRSAADSVLFLLTLYPPVATELRDQLERETHQQPPVEPE